MNLMHWLIVGALAYVFWRFVKSSGRDKASQRQHTSPVITWPALGDYDFEVVGESFHQPALKTIAGHHGDNAASLETTAVLMTDDNNPHDNKAVKVLINGQQVGHLSRDDARKYRRRLTAKKQGLVAAQCGALVMGGFIGKDGQRAYYGVRLDMKPFD